MRVYHYGTEIGTVYHQVAYLGVSSLLINQLAKYDIDLESFMESLDIFYQIIQPQSTLETYNPALGLHLHIKWEHWHCPNSGTINGHYFCHRYDRDHGNFIELSYNNQPYFTFSNNTPDEIQPYFDYIWRELEQTGYINHPKEISIGSKVSARLPVNYNAYETDDENQCRVERFKKIYCYITRYRDTLYYTSFSTNPTLYPFVKSNSLDDAIAAVEEVLTLTYD